MFINTSDIILRNLPDAVLITDKEGRIMYVNKAAENLFHKPASKLINENFGYPVMPNEIQEMEIASRKKLYSVEMLAATIVWEKKEAFLMSLRDVTEKKKLEIKLQETGKQLRMQSATLKVANRALKESNLSLEQFAHVAGHDLKEPVRKIKIFTGILQDGCDIELPENCKAYLKKIDTAADRMTTMIDGIFAYSGTNAGEEPLEKIDLKQIIEDVKSDLEIPVTQKKAVIEFTDLPEIEGAKVLIHQLFYNLINNALKFSKKDVTPTIKISHEMLTVRRAPHVKIILKDNGIGFEQEYAEKIFDTFARLHTKDAYDGSGLGLSLCKKIAERHKGTISAKGNENAGAEFHITLPLKQKGKIV